MELQYATSFQILGGLQRYAMEAEMGNASTQAADRAAGTRLLEVACQHCNTRTFLHSFPAWSTQLLTIVKTHREEDQVLSINDGVMDRSLVFKGTSCTSEQSQLLQASV